MTGTGVPHEHGRSVEIQRGVFGKRAADAKQVHDRHRLRVFHFILAGDGHPARREPRRAEDDRRHAHLVFRDPGGLGEPR